MTFQVTFKTPDAVLDAVSEAVSREYPDLPDEEWTEKRDEILRVTDRFTRYGEYVTIEFDTEAGTATVQKVGR